MLSATAFLAASSDCSAAASNGTHIETAKCGAFNAVQQWIFPPKGTPGQIKLKADPSLCFDVACDQTPCFEAGKYGPDAFVITCSASSATFTINSDKTINIESANLPPQKVAESWCLDQRSGSILQAYPCVGSPNQDFGVMSNGQLIEADMNCASACIAPAPTPAPPSGFCARYHPIHDPGVYDPSGPLLDDSGVWHQWEDRGAWSHWTSKDLIHWNGSFSQSTNFGGDTGSVSPTKSGVYAFWPIMSGAGKGAIGSAVAVDKALTQWTHRGPTIPMPKRINTGYRDPVRAFQYEDKWYVGVGCGSKEEGAQFCLFEAEDDTLANFTDRGSLYTTNVTFGEVDANIVWQPHNVSANMMECPDLFPLGEKWVLVGSLYKTNQWWVGTLSGSPPRFTPERVGILDYGNGYAAKTGSTMVQSGSSRRLVFGFTGWQEPTMPKGCGRALIIARELSVVGSELHIAPIAETQALRKTSTHSRVTELTSTSAAAAAAIAHGSQVELRLTCTGPATTSAGKVGVRTLATADGSQYTEIGYDFAAKAFYADHAHCCSSTPNAILQKAPLTLTPEGSDYKLAFAVFVDGGLIEAFLGGRVITPLVAPDEAAGAADSRVSTVTNTASGMTCDVESWKLAY